MVKNRPLSQHEDVLVFSKANVGSKIMMKYNKDCNLLAKL